MSRVMPPVAVGVCASRRTDEWTKWQSAVVCDLWRRDGVADVLWTERCRGAVCIVTSAACEGILRAGLSVLHLASRPLELSRRMRVPMRFGAVPRQGGSRAARPSARRGLSKSVARRKVGVVRCRKCSKAGGSSQFL